IRTIKRQQSQIIENRGVTGKRVTLRMPIDSVELKVSIKVLGYILVFILQWIPAIPYDIYQFNGRAAPWVYCMVIASVNSGVSWSRYGSSNSSSSHEQFIDGSKASSATLNHSNNHVKSIDIENGSPDINRN
ncbi:36352_t:CDS:2, partial [Racocetra persica]